jgi:hypothetical protein
VEYYSTKEGKSKKKGLNDQRSEGKPNLGHRGRETGQKPVPDGCRFDANMVRHVRMVTSLIEGRRVSVDEILEMLARAVRQHSIARRKRIDYVLWYLKKNAP